MAAIGLTMLSLLEQGDRVVAHKWMFSVAKSLFRWELGKLGITTDFVEMNEPDALEEALRQPAKLVYFEPLTNPRNEVLDTESLCAIAHTAGAMVAVDNTFLSPYLFQPLRLGADIVVQSATKYIGGHGDAAGGIISVGSSQRDLVEVIAKQCHRWGLILSPLNAFLLLRGLETLPVRMQQHCSNAQRVAEFLAGHPQVREVVYAGLPQHSGYEIATRQWRGYGGMLNWRAGNKIVARRVLERVRLITPEWSLGDTASLLIGSGPSASCLRMSVGLESSDAIIADLAQALDGAV